MKKSHYISTVSTPYRNGCTEKVRENNSTNANLILKWHDIKRYFNKLQSVMLKCC